MYTSFGLSPSIPMSTRSIEGAVMLKWWSGHVTKDTPAYQTELCANQDTSFLG